MTSEIPARIEGVIFFCFMDWISVKDKLPENNVWVLIANKDGVFTECGIHCADCETGFGGTDTGWLTANSPHREDRVTHWMPLPEPPK